MKRLLLTICALTFIATVQGAEYEIRPAITVSEEFTDNVFETRTSRQSDFITRFLPGLAFTYKAPFWEWDVGYSLDYRLYGRSTRDNDTTHNLSARGKLNLIDNFLFLDIADDYNRVSLDVAKEVSRESLFVDQSDQNVFSASPYIQLQPMEVLTLKVGYRYGITWYEEESAVDKTDHSGFAEALYELSEKWNINSGFTFTHQDSERKDYDRQDAFLGSRYQYSENCFLYGQAGASTIRYNTGEKHDNPFWNAGITHTFDTVVVNLNSGVSFVEDPLNNLSRETSYSGNVEKTLKRGMIGLSGGYSEFVKTETEERDTTRYSGTIRGQHELSELLSGELAFTVEKYDRANVELLNIKSSTRKMFVDAGLTLLLGEKATSSILYRYVDYHSKDIPWDNKEINRIIVQFSQFF